MFQLDKIETNPKNPYTATQESMEVLKANVQRYPNFLSVRPIVYDPETGYILGGNKRYMALIQLGYTEVPEEWVRSAQELTEEEKREFIFADNASYGKYDLSFVDEESKVIWDIVGEYKPEQPSNTEEMASSNLALMKLFYDEDTDKQFRHYVSELAKEFGTEDLTSTVYAAVMYAKDNLK